MVELIELCEENWLDFAGLSVDESQKHYLASNIGIIARGYVYRDCRARVIGIAADGQPAGLALVKDMDEEPACYDLQQFMIDRRFQGRGYGTEALKMILAGLEKEHKYDCVEVCVKKDDAAALHLYEKAGFRDTGYIDEDAPDSLNLMYRLAEADIRIEEIPVERMDEFWDLHFRYLVDDGIITDEEDKEYFSGEEYREIIRGNMERNTDRHHMIWFRNGDKKIGAAQYNTYASADGECFILDFWVFPEYRNRGLGHKCFEALERYTKKDGAVYYQINSEKEDSVRFWKSLGFVENGKDEYDAPLFIKN